MYRRFWVFLLATLLLVTLIGWQLVSTVAVSAQHRKTGAEQARLPVKLSILPTEDALQLQQQMEAARHKAFEHGYYACCIQPPCSWCMLHLGKCTCVLGVGSGQWACRECHGGWEAGQGRIPGKTREDVRHMKTLAVDETSGVSQAAEPAPAEIPTASTRGKPFTTDTRTVATGEKLFRKLNCLSCHTIGNKGSGVGPDLTHEAQRHTDIAWQIAHLQHPDKVHPGSTMPSFANLKPEELQALAAYLVARK